MLGINKCSDTSCFLSLGDGMDGEGGFTRRFGTVDLYDTSAGVTSHTQCHIQTDRAGRDDRYFFDLLVSHFHDRPFPVSFFNLVHRRAQRLQLLTVLVLFFFFHNVQFLPFLSLHK